MTVRVECGGKGVARGADGAAAPPWHVTAPPWGGAEGAAAPPWHGCKDPKLTKKRGKHKKKMIKNY